MNNTNNSPTVFTQTYFHGTKADLVLGDLITPGQTSNFAKRSNSKFIYLTSTLDAAIWGAELAQNGESERIYLVEPTGELEDDPDLTNQRFPGNPTRSYRSRDAFKVVGEVTVWQGHSPEQIQAMKKGIEKHDV